jgi:hypothetical protein
MGGKYPSDTLRTLTGSLSDPSDALRAERTQCEAEHPSFGHRVSSGHEVLDAKQNPERAESSGRMYKHE